MADRVFGMPRYEAFQFRHTLLKLSHLKGDEPALAPRHVVIGRQFQVAIPSRGGIRQRPQIAGGQRQQFLDIRAVRSEASGLRKQRDRRFRMSIGVFHRSKRIQYIHILWLLPACGFQYFPRPLKMAGVPCHHSEIGQ